MTKVAKSGLLLSSLVMLVVLGLVGRAGAAGEVIVCHATGSNTNTFNIIVTDESSSKLEGHLAHEDDIIKFDPTAQQLEDAKFLTQAEGGPNSADDITAFCESLEEPPGEEPPAEVPPAEEGAPPVTG